jgi:hypothetical protein
VAADHVVPGRASLWSARHQKEAYEALHTETRHGAIAGGHDQSRQLGDSADRFTDDTAAKTVPSERAIQQNGTNFGNKLEPGDAEPVLIEGDAA